MRSCLCFSRASFGGPRLRTSRIASGVANWAIHRPLPARSTVVIFAASSGVKSWVLTSSAERSETVAMKMPFEASCGACGGGGWLTCLFWTGVSLGFGASGAVPLVCGASLLGIEVVGAVVPLAVSGVAFGCGVGAAGFEAGCVGVGVGCCC